MVLEFRDVACGGAEYAQAMPLAGVHVVLLIVLPFAGLSYLVWDVPALTLAKPERSRSLRFLYRHYRPRLYYWSLTALTTNILLAATPVLAAQDGLSQSMVFALVCQGYLLATAAFQPFQRNFEQRVEIGVYGLALLQIGLAGFAGLVDSPGVEVSLDASARQTRSFWLVAVSITTLVFFGGVLLGVVYQVAFPPPPPDHTPELEALADFASLERPKQVREGARIRKGPSARRPR